MNPDSSDSVERTPSNRLVSYHQDIAGWGILVGNPNQKPPMRYLTVADLMRATALSRSSLYRAIARGQLPRPSHPFGMRRAVWPEDQLEHILQQGLALASIEDPGNR